MTHDEALATVRARAGLSDSAIERPFTAEQDRDTLSAICVVLNWLATRDQPASIPMTPHESAARAEAWRRIEERGAEVVARISENGC